MAKRSMTREKEARRDEQRRLQQQSTVNRERKRNRDRWVKVGGGLAAAILLVGAFFIAQRGTSTAGGAPVSAWLGAPTTALAASPSGQYTKALQTLKAGNKPEVLFVGALYCPFCASERWALVKALGWFGTWSNLQTSTSQGGSGGFAAIPTFGLLHARYRSRYVAFESKDIENENSQPLQSLSPSEQSLFNRYDPTGGIPMVLVADHVMLGAAYQPSELQGQAFHTVQSALQDGGSSQLVHDVNAEANLIAAFLCRADGMQPATVCGRSVTQGMVRRLR